MPPPQNDPRICTIWPCGRAYYAKGLCYSHYMRGWRGRPSRTPIRAYVRHQS